MKMKKIFESYERFLDELKELPGDEVDYIRIGIAKEIDATLQRPSNDQEINKLLRAKAPSITKRNANLLLYLYRGVDEKGNLLNNENVKAVIDELDKRAENFLDSFETQAHFLVFLNDAPLLMNEYMPRMREVSKQDSHQSKFMLKTAPGHFDAFQFAKKKPFAIFSDTTANSGMKDFMHKQTPELHNINPQHHYLFKLEFLIEIAYDIVKDNIDFLVPDKDQIDIDIKPLIPQRFIANYLKGITVTTDDYRKELQKKPHPTFGPMVKSQRYAMNKLFRYYYYGDYLRDSKEKQIKLIDDYMPQILDLDTENVKAGLVPNKTLLLGLVWKNFPKESQEKYKLPFTKILYTVKNSKWMTYSYKDIINRPGVLDRERGDTAFLPMGSPGETEDHRKEYAEHELNKMIDMAKNKENIYERWQEFNDLWSKLASDTKEELKPKIKELTKIIEGDNE